MLLEVLFIVFLILAFIAGPCAEPAGSAVQRLRLLVHRRAVFSACTSSGLAIGA